MTRLMNGLMLTAIVGLLIYAVITSDLIRNVSIPVFQLTDTEGNKEEYVSKVKQCMMEGKQELVVHYKGANDKLEKFVSGAVEEAFKMDSAESSSDYDYMKFKYAGMNVNMRGFGRMYMVTYKFDYLESKEQTDIVDKKIGEIFNKLDIKKQSSYDKIKMIHDYIIKNCTYDLSTSKNSAYSCLMEGTSACQGYASLVYKMMTEAGIPCRIISGKGQNQSHAWNIVELNGHWFNLDCTWDDPVGKTGKEIISYDFFLKNNQDFSYHVRDREFNTKEFNQIYKMSENSY